MVGARIAIGAWTWRSTLQPVWRPALQAHTAGARSTIIRVLHVDAMNEHSYALSGRALITGGTRGIGRFQSPSMPERNLRLIYFRN